MDVITEKPPGGSWLHPVVNCSKRAISVWLKLLTAVQNQPSTLRNSGELPLAMWCIRKSEMEYSPVPQSNSSSSFSSKIESKLSGIMPFKPLRKLSTSSRTLLHKRCWANASKYCGQGTCKTVGLTYLFYAVEKHLIYLIFAFICNTNFGSAWD